MAKRQIDLDRRNFLKRSAILGAGVARGALFCAPGQCRNPRPRDDLS